MCFTDLGAGCDVDAVGAAQFHDLFVQAVGLHEEEEEERRDEVR